jgi:hypothetical protein
MKVQTQFHRPLVARVVNATKPAVRPVVVVILSCLCFGCREKAGLFPEDNDMARFSTSSPELSRQIELFCGDCHTVPRPEAFPRDRWHEEVRIGYQQYARSGRNDLIPPPIAAVIDYYRQRAPETLQFNLPANQNGPLVRQFLAEDIDWAPTTNPIPAVACLVWSKIAHSSPPHLIVSDMREGTITAVDLSQAHPHARVLAKLDFPSRVEPCDLDGSGLLGFVVAELGSFFAVDHTLGKVLWLKASQEDGQFEIVTLASGLGRVDDVRVADFDQDGDQDIVAAEFGHYHTGGIILLENNLRNNNQVSFTIHRLDTRTGTIHVPILDFNRDGQPDFAALVSNESESLDLFLNLGQNKFLVRPIWRAPDLTFGSSGIEIVDLDGDGDPDILYTNGDTFDNLYANPSHGLQWLENVGDSGFRYHRLLDLPGAYRAVAADLDGDGDLDIVLSAWLPRRVKPINLRRMQIPSVVLLEQVKPMEFRTQILDTNWPQYPVLAVADLDGDGDLDLAAGRHVGLDDPPDVHLPRLRVWWNQRVPGRTPASK